VATLDRTEFPGPNRINHVAISVPADLLDEQGRADLVAFFSEVFGWHELPTMTVDRQRLIFSLFSHDRFVFLIADDPPMACPPGLPGDHFGVQVDRLEELETVVARAEEFRARDGRVEIHPYEIEDHGVLKLHNVYVRFLLPMSVEVQYFELVGA
jgi:catechol 2,3-dioxygenase-like lactoylglutathione lyase family enzyme